MEQAPEALVHIPWRLELGANVQSNGGVRFRVWAPRAERLAVKLVERGTVVPLERGAGDLFEATVAEAGAGTDYLYVFDGERERPDPVSRWQPQGVHGPSRVVNPAAFSWTDTGWKGVRLEDLVIYELHVGTFTPAGTFDAVVEKLPHLEELGVNAVEIMPVAEFPGSRNWGYDGAHPYAPHSAYGGPAGLKRLVDACHRRGLAVVLDVVYNHLGPEGTYVGEYAPYYTDHYRTPWGGAINYDGPQSDGVRRYVIENALYWQTEYHVDALRLDAVHGIYDFSALHILEELAAACQAQAEHLGRPIQVIAESDLNDARIIRPVAEGGYGLDAQWSDDFHHSLYTLLTGRRRGYLVDFGRVTDLAKALREGFVYDGRYSEYRRRRHGNSSTARPGRQFVVCTQNHDQVANASAGERLSSLATLEQCTLADAVLLCAPFVPLLFMGQEHAEPSPFLYFTSHGDPGLAEAVREGRRREFQGFGVEVPDPQDPGTLERSRITWECLTRSPHAEVLRLHRDLIRLRKQLPALGNCRKDLTAVDYSEDERWMTMHRGDPAAPGVVLLCSFSSETRRLLLGRPGRWRRLLWTGDPAYGGAGASPPPEIVEVGARQTAAVPVAPWTAVLYHARSS